MCTYDSHEAALDKWEAQSHESFVNADWRFGDLGQKRNPNGKTNAMDAPSIMRETFSKECVSSTGFGQRPFISQTGFRQCGNVDIVSAELSGNEGSTSCRSISILVVQKSSNVRGCKSERLMGRCAKFSTAGKRCSTGAVRPYPFWK